MKKLPELWIVLSDFDGLFLVSSEKEARRRADLGQVVWAVASTERLRPSEAKTR